MHERTGDLIRSLRAGQFLGAAVVVNFVVVPLVVAAMFGFLPADQGVRLGVLLVLLAPCVDYVIVVSGLAGGSSERLLAATPLLLVAQMVLLPVFLYLFMGPALVEVIEFGPFLEAFLLRPPAAPSSSPAPPTTPSSYSHSRWHCPTPSRSPRS